MQNMKETILSGENITKDLNGNHILQGISFTIYVGDFTVVMGSSGSGKSTLLYAFSGMDTVSNGHLFYQEKEITHASEKELSCLRAKKFGFVFQKMHLVSNLSLYENIVVAGYISRYNSEKEVRDRAMELIQHMKLLEAKNCLPSEVSGGEAQRACHCKSGNFKDRDCFCR